MKISNSNYGKLRRFLHKHNPHCCWCNIKTEIFDGFVIDKYNQTPPNMATLEHVYSRNCDIPRIRGNEKFIACYKCNSEKGRIEENMMREMGRKFTLKEYEEFNESFKRDNSSVQLSTSNS